MIANAVINNISQNISPLGLASLIRLANSLAAKPPNTTE